MFCSALKAQLSGVVTDQNGEPLPYACIYLEGTTKGTVANEDGYYSLEVEKGVYNVLFQYIGYQRYTYQLHYKGKPISFNVALSPLPFEFGEVVISADQEDPAYPIMRQVIAHRDENRSKIKSYEADVYIKGVVKLLDAPESFLGQDIGNMDGVLDSTRQGILYLSESQSTIYYEAPNKLKEVMHSSIVSGSDDGINVNQFNNARFDFYDEHQQFNRSLLSPLADNAFSFYKFKLLGSTVNDRGETIDRIEVIPESPYKPLYKGEIYINEKDWSLQSVDLAFTGAAVKQKFFDTIQISQVFVELPDGKGKPLYSQNIKFRGRFLGFTAGGTFTYIFNDHQINIEHPKGLFNAELFSMTEDAIVKDTLFWQQQRPVPLTKEEKRDYARKDSLRRIWESKPYLDSLDRENNRFKFSDIFFGYDYHNSYKKKFYTVKSPITTFQYNAVEGVNLKWQMEARIYGENENNQLSIEPYLQYGFADEQLKAKVDIRYRYDRKKRGHILLKAGREYVQHSRTRGTRPLINTAYTLLRKKNEYSMFDLRSLKLSHFKEHRNGWYIQPTIALEQRVPLENNITEVRGTLLRPNNEIWRSGEYFNVIPTEKHTALLASLRLVWRPNQKYMTFPNWRARVPSGAPTLEMVYTKGFLDTKFNKLWFSISDNEVNANLWGHLAYNLEAGVFFNDEMVPFTDYFHFKGDATNIGFSSQYLFAFKRMPQYRYSTKSDYVAAFVEHHFDGFILDRVPLLRNLGAELVIGTNLLHAKDHYYHEYNAGFENLGVGPFNLFRFDVVYRRGTHDPGEWGVKLGLTRIFE